MPDNIRQEAVERLKRSMPMMGRSICADIEYLIDQLAEAIAQRDEALDALKAFMVEVAQQLAAERALCDRAADYIRHQPARDVVWRDGWLGEYDAHRAAERSEAEGS